MANLFDLTGKVAVVTGGAGGIGKAIALGMADAGADVVVVSRKLEHLTPVVKEIEAKHKKSMAVAADVTSVESAAAAVKQITDKFGRIDILVNAHGIAIRKPADTFPIEEFRQVLDINSTGTFIMCQAVGKTMIPRKMGRIINLSSVRGQYGLPADYAAYCTSKGAVDTLTKDLACEWAKHNILVNAIAPTIVETDLTKPALANPAFATFMKARIPMGRWGQPEEMAGACIFFASAAANFVTGQILYIDGGVTTM